ncbi:alpha/beta family hydrolase, partial [Streptomyces tendae]
PAVSSPWRAARKYSMTSCRTTTLSRMSYFSGFPLHPPGKPEKSRADELLGTGVPTLVVQGGNDPFGRPEEFPEAPAGTYDLIEVPYADHGFAVPKRAEISQEEALELITAGVLKWTGSLG